MTEETEIVIFTTTLNNTNNGSTIWKTVEKMERIKTNSFPRVSIVNDWGKGKENKKNVVEKIGLIQNETNEIAEGCSDN